MKIFKHRNILGLIFGLMALIPLVSIGVKCAYVSMNKNAYQSYSGQDIDNYIPYDSIADVPLNTTIYSYLDNNTTYANTYYLSISDLDFIQTNIDNLPNVEQVSYIRYYTNNGLLFTDSNYSSLGLFNISNKHLFMSFKLLSYSSNDLQGIGNTLGFMNYINGSLDNVFEYSISEITKDNNLGKVGFFTWFASMFLDLNNATNMLYIGFVNWYFNYLLLVSLGYVLFAVLMWFINYIRRLLEKGQDFGHGGY